MQPQDYLTPVRTGQTVLAGTPVPSASPKRNHTKWIAGFAVVLVLMLGGLAGRAWYRLAYGPYDEFMTIIEQVLSKCGADGSEVSCRQAMGASSNGTGGEVEYVRNAMRLMRDAGGEVKDVEYGGFCSVQVSALGSGKLTATIEFARGVQDVVFTFVHYKGQWHMNGMYAGRPAPEVCS